MKGSMPSRQLLIRVRILCTESLQDVKHWAKCFAIKVPSHLILILKLAL